ncbi:hypothetical protein MMC22_005743 [Lobaria immixta]|nr:hypothetical protein [Lobaria immixta]
MAICLAEMHWDVKIDAADVDFVLGTAPEKRIPKPTELAKLTPRTDTASGLNCKRRSVHLWPSPHSGKMILVTRDLCPPGHLDAELRAIFEAHCLQYSDKKSDGKARGKIVARQFIEEVVVEMSMRYGLSSAKPTISGRSFVWWCISKQSSHR